jgi:phosphate starvation-inducible protein PhoH and related proteins
MNTELQKESRVVNRRKDRSKIIKPKNNFENLSLKEILPLTESQRQMFRSFIEGANIVATGSAGTGKTFVAMYLALKKLFNHEVDKIIILRSIVATRDVGYLPGSLLEKTAPFWALYKDHVDQICGNGTAWDILFKKGYIEFETTSFMRGRTWNDSVIIIDEVQNLAKNEVYSALTRVGHASQVVLCGDNKQTDLPKKETSWEYLNLLINKTGDLFDTVNFVYADIVRSDFVKQIIIADHEINGA